VGFLSPLADLATAPILALQPNPEPEPNSSGAPEVELPLVEMPEYKTGPFGEPLRPQFLDMELDLIRENPSILDSPHDLVDHFILMESVSGSAGQGGGRCPSDFLCPDLVFHGSEPFFPIQILRST
jgi:hypothetical protein